MAWGSKLSINGLLGWDDSLFDDMKIPDGVDRDTAVNRITSVCADIPLLYADWGYMRAAIGTWSATRLRGWEKVRDVLNVDYDPIANYDRKEEWTDEADGGSALDVAAFNGDDLVRQNEAESRTSSKHSGRVSGNIGVTSTQDLIRQEIGVSGYNVYDVIAEDFKTEFCLLVY